MNRSFGHQKGRASIGTDIKRDWHQWGRASKGTADIKWDGHQSGLASNGPPWHQSGRASMRSASIGPASIGWHQSGVVLLYHCLCVSVRAIDFQTNHSDLGAQSFWAKVVTGDCCILIYSAVRSSELPFGELTCAVDLQVVIVQLIAPFLVRTR